MSADRVLRLVLCPSCSRARGALHDQKYTRPSSGDPDAGAWRCACSDCGVRGSTGPVFPDAVSPDQEFHTVFYVTEAAS